MDKHQPDRDPEDIVAATLVAQFGFTAKTARTIADFVCFELGEANVLVLDLDLAIDAVLDASGQ